MASRLWPAQVTCHRRYTYTLTRRLTATAADPDVFSLHGDGRPGEHATRTITINVRTTCRRRLGRTRFGLVRPRLAMLITDAENDGGDDTPGAAALL